MYFKKIGKNRYIKCSKCGVTRNIDEVLGCTICKEIATKGRAFRRRQRKRTAIGVVVT